MLKEPSLLLLRRSLNRIAESGLLLLGVALGVGAAAAGFSLFAHVQRYGRDLLSSPAYREIVVSTQDSAEEMAQPVVLRPVEERAVLTSADLSAAQLIPQISHAYVSNPARIRFLGTSLLSGLQGSGAGPGQMIFAGPPPDGAEVFPNPSPQADSGHAEGTDNRAAGGAPGAGQGASAEQSAGQSAGPIEGADGAAAGGTPEAGQGTSTDQSARQSAGQTLGGEKVIPDPTPGTTRGQSISGVAGGTGALPADNQSSGEAGAFPSGALPEGVPEPPDFSALRERITTAAKDPDILLPEVEELRGYEVTSEFFDSWNLEILAGSLFSPGDLENNQSMIILGYDTARLIAGEGTPVESLLGKKLLTLQGFRTIIGILKPAGRASLDSEFFLPYSPPAGSSTILRWRSFNTQLRFAVADPARLGETEELLTQWFNREFGEGQVVISNPRSEAEQLLRRNVGISLLVLFLALSGLFIAAVNVSNILMSRAMRMKNQVGILMALGASKKGILSLFATEAGVVALSGSVLGMILAIPLSGAMNSALGLGSASLLYSGLGALLAGGVALLFSLLPLGEYTRLTPAEAFRDV